MINTYFADFENNINNQDFIYGFEINKRKVNDFLGIIEGKLTLRDGVLDVLEVIKLTNNQLSKKKYKYHFRNHSGDTIFRYDNVPHHPHILSFPHHKHIKGEITESTEPDILQVLSEIRIHLFDK